MGVAPASLPSPRITGHGLLGNVATMFAVPLLELPSPAFGLPLGVDVEQGPAQCQELLAGHGFWVQGQFGFDVQPGMEATALDNGTWPDSLNGLEHTLLAITDNVVRCRDK